VLPNPATRGDTHLHECALDGDHDRGVEQRHRCACGVQWAHDLRPDGRSATLIRFPTDRTPEINLRDSAGPGGTPLPEKCVVCAENIGGYPSHEFGGARYHLDCTAMFRTALQSAHNILGALAQAPDPVARQLFLVRLIAAMSRSER
jgi:hypothetical protein